MTKRIKAAPAMTNQKYHMAYITQIWGSAPPQPKIISSGPGFSFSCDRNKFKRFEKGFLQSLEMTDQPQSLKELLQTAKAQKQSIEYSTEPNSDAYRQEVSATIDKLRECQRLINQLSLFSSNEALEDVSTSNLQYDLCEHVLILMITNNHFKDS
jgi:hypothetical protein